MRELTAKQKEILDFIIACFREEGYIPTLREIAGQFSFRSINAVNDHLNALERKGYINRRPGSSRGIMLPPEVLADSTFPSQSRVVGVEEEYEEEEQIREQMAHTGEAHSVGTREFRRGAIKRATPGTLPGEREGLTDGLGREGPSPLASGIPIIGRAAAGKPITAVENLEGYLDLGTLYGREHFALHIRGDSMIDAGIWDGDFVIVREQPAVNNGEIAVAIIEGEATVKRVQLSAGHAELIPANEMYSPIHVDLSTTSFRIAGRVVGVHRVIR